VGCPEAGCYRITEPCRWLRRAKFVDAMGEQRWTARENIARRGGRGWNQLLDGYDSTIPSYAIRAAACFTVVNRRRGIDLVVVAMPTLDCDL
jgi:hypothetical protein